MFVIHFAWPVKGPAPMGLPVCGSHNRTDLSMLPVASRAPSGDQATQSTQCVCPERVYLGVPVSVSHIRAVLSPDPVARRELVAGLNCAARIASPWPGILCDMRVTACTLKTDCGSAVRVTVV